MGSYLGASSSFHKHMMDVQQQVLVSYLETARVDDESEDPATEMCGPADSAGTGFHSGSHAASTQRLSFLADAEVHQTDGAVFVKRLLSTKTDLYLLDHAIGGAVSSTSGDRVHLLPLMV